MEKSVSTNKTTCKMKVDQMRDKISDLPDPLLLHILSFLPAKEAVATSLLSKRWTPLWRSLPTLDLKRDDFQRLTSFHQFVEKMLKFVDLKSVKKVVLWFDFYKPREYFRPQKISKWIDALMSNKVEHVELHLKPHKGNYELPFSVYNAKNIKVLKLTGVWDMWTWNHGVAVGTLSHVNLPLLEVLHLEAVTFPDVRSLEMLLSACPLLKDLVLKHLYCKSNSPLDIGGLNHLVTADVEQYLLSLKAFSNVTFLCLRHKPFLYDESSPLLSSNIPTFHNLTYLEFEYSSHDWETTLELLQSCPKLEILVIHQFVCSGSLEPDAVVPHCVSSNLKEFHLGRYGGKNHEFELARFIMKNARVLRIISISKDCYCRATWKNRNLRKIASCPISSVNCTLLLK